MRLPDSSTAYLRLLGAMCLGVASLTLLFVAIGEIADAWGQWVFAVPVAALFLTLPLYVENPFKD